MGLNIKPEPRPSSDSLHGQSVRLADHRNLQLKMLPACKPPQFVNELSLRN